MTKGQRTANKKIAFCLRLYAYLCVLYANSTRFDELEEYANDDDPVIAASVLDALHLNTVFK